MSKVRLAILLLALANLAGDSSCDPRPECRSFFVLSLQERHQQFRTYPIEKQLDAYLCAMTSEPPDLSLAGEIADRGEAVIPNVVNRLKATHSEVEQQNLIYVLEVMSDRGYLRDRNDVVADVSQVIDGMKISTVKNGSLDSLKKIQINSHVKPFTYQQ